MENYKNVLIKLKEKDNYRIIPENNSLQLINLCSNDYLGINSNKKFYDSFCAEYNAGYGFGSCSSRLLSSSLKEHSLLEKNIAQSYQAEACLLFNSGYHANTGIISAIAKKKDLVLTDKLVHASIIDGVKLSSASFLRYKHLDYSHLEFLLKKYRKNHNNVFIISESIFSMDGDIANLHSLIELKKRYNAYLYIDEAHAFGVRGKNGLGCVEEENCINEVDFIVGTFGKALASVGAFVVCNNIFKEFLVNHARTFIFSTALPPINIVWTNFIFQRLPDMKSQREKLKTLSLQFATLLNLKPGSHIIPFIIGENSNTIKKSDFLKENGFFVLPVRYPTVPKNTARLRFSLNASLKIEQLLPIKEILK